MSLVEIVPTDDVMIDLAYSTSHNFTGKPIYQNAHCYLHQNAKICLDRAVSLLKPLGLRLKIWDAFRPQEAQWKLWEHTPDTTFVADPRRGSPHSRGVAVDLTLVDQNGQELDMGTEFDDFRELAFHRNQEISNEAQKNRLLLLGVMTAAGWDFYEKEWWHYQLFQSRDYPLLSDKEVEKRLMT